MRRINLLEDAGPAPRTPGWASRPRAMTTMGWVAACIWAAGGLLHASLLGRGVERAERSVSMLRAERDRHAKLEREREDLVETTQWLQRAAPGGSITRVITTAADSVPDSAALTRLTFRRHHDAQKREFVSGPGHILGEIRLEGLATDNFAVSELLRLLEQSGYCRDARLVQSDSADAPHANARRFIVTTSVASAPHMPEGTP